MSERADLTLADVARLEDVLDADALVEVCRSASELCALPVRVVSCEGERLAAEGHAAEGHAADAPAIDAPEDLAPEGAEVADPRSPGAFYRVAPIAYQGRRLGHFVIGPYSPSLTASSPAREGIPRVPRETAERLSAHLLGVIDVLLFSGHRAILTTEMHVASVRESYRALSEKTAALQKAYDELKELDRLKSNFLATVSHELRTPLTSIIGYSDMLATGLAGPLNAEQSEFVDTIRNKGDHLLALITSMLDLNQMERGELTIEREPIDACALVHEVAKTLAPQAAKKQISVEVELGDELPSIEADAVRIRQVLLNLVENAVKFSPAGARVVIGARATTAPSQDEMGLALMGPRRALELVVTDDGPGIPESQRERIFDAFYQVDGSSTRTHGGTGLGLSIVKRLVEAHGGEVWVDSAPSGGSIFRCVLADIVDE